LTVDHLAICTDGGTVTLYPDPTGEPLTFTDRQLPGLLKTLTDQPGGVRNLTFAFTGACFATRRQFEEEYANLTARLRERETGQTVFRLAFQPLSAAPGAADALLTAWRSGSVEDGP
jgi:hypothetical protein